MKTYQLADIIPSGIMESGMPKVKMGYAKYLTECISKRAFLETSNVASGTLNRIADKTIAELSRSGAVDPSAFSALVVFADKVTNILHQLTKQYHEETDAEAKKKLASLILSHKFLSNPAQDGILKKALAGSKSAPGNRLAKFISMVIQLVAEKKSGHPIEDFKKEITHLREAIEKFYYGEFPFQATIKPYKTHLLGPNSIIDIMDKIADNLVNSEPDISKLNSPIIHKENKPTGFKDNVPHGNDPRLTNHVLSHRYEAQSTFMEAFAESLDYFSRRNR
jgi:hypothetical protein